MLSVSSVVVFSIMQAASVREQTGSSRDDGWTLFDPRASATLGGCERGRLPQMPLQWRLEKGRSPLKSSHLTELWF